MPQCEVLPLEVIPNECLRRVPAPAGGLIHFEIIDPLVAATIEVVGTRYPGLLRRLDEIVEHRPFQALMLDTPLTAVAVKTGVVRIRIAPPWSRR